MCVSQGDVSFTHTKQFDRKKTDHNCLWGLYILMSTYLYSNVRVFKIKYLVPWSPNLRD